MNITILTSGRFGNFLRRLKNAIHIGLYYNYNVIIPHNPFFLNTYFVINDKITIEDEKFTDVYSFFYTDRILNIDKNLFELNKDKVTNIMKQSFIFKNIYPLGNNDLVIHIRSGDIFNSYPHSGYIMPPLKYYTRIIEENSFDNIYLIAEDRLNPCINNLLYLFPKIIFKIQSLEEDIKIILSTKNIVISYGTFIPELIELSDNIKYIYTPSYFIYNKIGCETYITDLTLYHHMMSPWKNTKEQREMMITYKC